MKVGVGLFTGQIPPGSDRTFHRDYADILELTEAVESAGLDSAWVSEHHFAGDGYLPALVPMLAAMAARTERIELGTGVILAPFHDPLRLAEDIAVADQISGGRVICGLGIGWRPEIAGFVAQLPVDDIALVPNGDLQFVPEQIARQKIQRLGAAKTAQAKEAVA